MSKGLRVEKYYGRKGIRSKGLIKGRKDDGVWKSEMTKLWIKRSVGYLLQNFVIVASFSTFLRIFLPTLFSWLFFDLFFYLTFDLFPLHLFLPDDFTIKTLSCKKSKDWHFLCKLNRFRWITYYIIKGTECAKFTEQIHIQWILYCFPLFVEPKRKNFR